MVLPILALLSGCTRERITEGPDWEGALPVQFTLSIPGANGGSRAMTDDDENSITAINVLAFYQSGSDYVYGYAPSLVSNSVSGDGTTMTMTVKVNISDMAQQFVILVNASAELASAAIQPNDRLADAMDKVLSMSNGEWPARKNGTGPFKAIPMYAKSIPQVVTSTATTLGSSDLVRMVARMDVSLKSTILPAKFVLTEGMLFNYQKGGYVSYERSSFDTSSGTGKATAAAVPAAGVNPGDPILEPTTPYSAAVGGAIKQMLYTYESPAYTEANKLKGTALVVGGKYNGSPTTTYYRINIKTITEPVANYTSPILRNHLYDVVIQDVTGPGYSTPMEAYRGDSSGITVQIQAWNQANRDYPIGQESGPYNLVVNSESFAILPEGTAANSLTLTITSNNPAGWSIGTPTYSPAGTEEWLTIAPMTGTTGTIPVTLTATPNYTANRSATFVITVGNLKKTITVTQAMGVAPTLTVNPNSLTFAANSAPVGSNTVSVTTNVPTGWTTSTSYPDGTSGWCTVTPGTPNTFFAVNVSPNNTFALRTAIITVSADGATPQTVTVTQEGKDINTIPGGGTAAAANTYIGAFWKHDQKGERIIRITNVNDAGAWTASAGWYDSKWNAAGGDGLIFSTDATSDPNVKFDVDATPADMNVASNDATYFVSGSASSASGTVSAGGTIMFRVGCQKTFTAWNDATNPARYAVVVLSYANNTKFQKIFIRQGEGADYVMSSTDAANSGGITSRTQCKQFTPYNLTVATFVNASVPVNGGIWTAYPSQAGAFFQWAIVDYPRVGYASWALTYWNTGTISDVIGVFWNTLSATHETCPSGYRRPTDGSTTSDYPGGDATLSEMRQSLYLNPQTGITSNLDNSVWGYYADGFFDRYRITNISIGFAPGTDCSVSVTNASIAHVGRLFYNATTGASLFFPAAGQRMSNSNGYDIGLDGFFWSSAVHNTGPWGLCVSSSDAYMYYDTSTRDHGYSIRCVRN